MLRSIFALALLCVLSTSAFAGPCPRVLGCGCNLANHLGISGKVWRQLWLAKNWLRYGSPASHGCVGCVAVTSRRGGGHVGIVRGYANGNPIIYSWGNRRTGWHTATYPRSRVLGYRYYGSSTTFSARVLPNRTQSARGTRVRYSPTPAYW